VVCHKPVDEVRELRRIVPTRRIQGSDKVGSPGIHHASESVDVRVSRPSGRAGSDLQIQAQGLRDPSSLLPGCAGVAIKKQHVEVHATVAEGVRGNREITHQSRNGP
jgi:hypothetical protein